MSPPPMGLPGAGTAACPFFRMIPPAYRPMQRVYTIGDTPDARNDVACTHLQFDLIY